MKMSHTLDLYRRLISVQMRSQLQHRVSFLLDSFATGFSVLVSFASLALIFQRFVNIGGWSLGEVGLLYGLSETAFGIMDMLFSGFDPAFFGAQVQRGLFDQLLLRPVDITTQVLGSQFLIRRLGRIAQGAAVLIIALGLLPVQWSLDKVLFIPVVLASLVCFFGGLFIIGATITFWTVESIEVINIFTYGGSEMISYPMHIYPDWIRRFFTFILPAIFLSYYPALYILGKSDPLGFPAFAPLLSPLAGVGVLLAALAFWRFGIQHYQSTGT
jgi:ABC-2 type transport system permease protein